jgi:hypothetical protein
MQQVTKIKQEMLQIKTFVTVMFHDRPSDLTGLGSVFARQNAASRSLLHFESVAASVLCHSSLSQNLTDKPTINKTLVRPRRPSLPQAKLFSAEARSALSAHRIYPRVFATTTGTDAPRAQVGDHPKRILVTSRLGDSCASSSADQSKPSIGLVSHDLKNVAAHLPVACGPETHSRGTSASSQI